MVDAKMFLQFLDRMTPYQIALSSLQFRLFSLDVREGGGGGGGTTKKAKKRNKRKEKKEI